MKIHVRQVDKVVIPLSNKWIRKNKDENLISLGRLAMIPTINLNKKDNVLEIVSSGFMFHVSISENEVENYNFYIIGIKSKSPLQYCFLISKYYTDFGNLKSVLDKLIGDIDTVRETYKAIAKEYAKSSLRNIYTPKNF